MPDGVGKTSVSNSASSAAGERTSATCILPPSALGCRGVGVQNVPFNCTLPARGGSPRVAGSMEMLSIVVIRNPSYVGPHTFWPLGLATNATGQCRARVVVRGRMVGRTTLTTGWVVVRRITFHPQLSMVCRREVGLSFPVRWVAIAITMWVSWVTITFGAPVPGMRRRGIAPILPIGIIWVA